MSNADGSLWLISRAAIIGKAAFAQIKFATDSPLERNGFEVQFRPR
jgi:hypothetical protein